MLLGIWLAGSIVMTFIAADSANAASRIMRKQPPGVIMRIKSMGENEARQILAYPVRQQARWWLEEWGNVELVFSVAFFFFLLFGTREGKVVLFFTLGICGLLVFQRYYMLPQLLYLDSLMDFSAVNALIPERNQLAVVRTAFNSIEILKLLLLLVLGTYLISRSRRFSHSAE